MKNLFTPRTPRFKYLLMGAIFLFSWKVTNSQQHKDDLSLKPLEEYKKALKLFYNKQWAATRKEFSLSSKGILHLVPSIGISFGLPSVSWSVSQYLNYKFEQKKIKLQVESLDASSEVDFQSKLQELEARYIIVESQLLRYRAYLTKESYQLQLYQIKKECCSKNECKPEECLQNEIQQLAFGEQRAVLKLEAVKALKELEIFAKYNLPSEHIYFTASECILDSDEFKKLRRP